MMEYETYSVVHETAEVREFDEGHSRPHDESFGCSKILLLYQDTLSVQAFT